MRQESPAFLIPHGAICHKEDVSWNFHVLTSDDMHVFGCGWVYIFPGLFGSTLLRFNPTASCPVLVYPFNASNHPNDSLSHRSYQTQQQPAMQICLSAQVTSKQQPTLGWLAGWLLRLWLVSSASSEGRSRRHPRLPTPVAAYERARFLCCCCWPDTKTR
jgi:hypothetical protein